MLSNIPGQILSQINCPDDLRKIARPQLVQLAQELRTFMLNSVAQTGGHLSSNLGTVELAIALHYVFNTPDDRLIWDVGHQSYAHKILTGRRDQMSSLRQLNGISGFPRRSESEYDAFGTAHSSTSISAALGMAVAAREAKLTRHSVAVIGDSALTGGMAFEALNHAGVEKNLRMLVILNDNDMSISRPVGALNRYLARLLSGRLYQGARNAGKTVLEHAPHTVRELLKRFEEHAKGMIVPSTLFEFFGFNYIGPIDGHDLEALIPTLQNLQQLTGPQFLHVITQKGHGYSHAERDPILYHGPSPFDPKVGIPSTSSTSSSTPSPQAKTSFTQIFSDWICDMAHSDTRLVGITPAMCEGSGLVSFAQQFPQRFFDVGIAEQHAVTFAAGFACENFKPVVAIYSTFLQRAYDQLIHDVALQNLDVTFAIDRAGIVGADGPTHAGLFDIAYLRCLPNMVLATPSDENECRALLTSVYQHLGPAAVRYPRGAGVGNLPRDQNLPIVPIGKGRMIRARDGSVSTSASHATASENPTIAILAFGPILHTVAPLAQHYNASLADMRYVKPLDHELVLELARTHHILITLEEGVIQGGAGSAVLELLAQNKVMRPVLVLGWPDNFPEQGTQAQIMAQAGLDRVGIQAKIDAFLRLNTPF